MSAAVFRRGLQNAAVAAALAVAAAAQTAPRTVVIARAATLAVPFDQLARALPQWQFQQQSGGSRFLLRQLLELGPRLDVLAVADAGLFAPAAANARAPRWWLEFAGNELVIAYTPRSRDAGEINSANWMEILLRPGVSFGYADPNLDPEGYNTLLAWQLAARYYHRPHLADRLRAAVPAANQRQHSVALLALLEAGQLDYAWEYLSVARQHGLRYVRLPAAMNLGDTRLAGDYAQVSVPLAGPRPGQTVRQNGRPIVYGVTIPATAANLGGAMAFLRLLVSPRGRAMLAADDQPPLVPPCVGGNPAAAPPTVAPWLAQWPHC